MTKKVIVENVQGGALLEGPFWDGEQGRLLCVDILNNALIFYDVQTKQAERIQVEDNVTSVVLDQKGDVLLSLRNRWGRFDQDGQSVEPVVHLDQLKPTMRFNDGKVDPYGRFWLGTMSEDSQRGKASLYVIDANGHITESNRGLTISNGLAWNKQATTMYTIDTPSRNIMAYPFSEGTTKLTEGDVVFDFTGMDGSPDGMTIDSEDRLWVALWGGGRVVCIDPKQKEIVDHISLPVTNVTSCTFGGTDLKTLYITTASTGLSEKQKQQEPLAGSLFSCRLSVAGTVSRKYQSFVRSDK